MKRLIYMVVLLLLANTVVALEKHSPWQVGLRTGVVISDMIYTSSAYDAYRYQFYGRGNIGLWVQREWGGFALRPEVDITGRGTVRKTDDIYYALKPRYVDIRLSFRYTFLRDKIVQPYIFLTPNFNIALNGNLTYKDPSANISRAMTKADIAPFNFSTMLGVGMRFPMIINRKPFYLSFDAGYNFGFLDTYSDQERNGTVSHIGSDAAAEGHRYSSNVELALGVGVPFSSFGKVKSHKYKSVPSRSYYRNAYTSRPAYSSSVSSTSKKKYVDYHEPDAQEQPSRWVEQLSADPKTIGQQMTRKMNSYVFNLPTQDKVSSNVKLTVTPSLDITRLSDGTQQRDIHLLFAYETLPTSSTATVSMDDYPLGAYLTSSSKACMATLNYLREQLASDEIAPYLHVGRRVSIIITGETDGTPLQGNIAYKGEYGIFANQACVLNNVPTHLSVSPQSGISTNAQLGLLRTQGVKYFLDNYVESLQPTINTYQYQIRERHEKGSQYRRIAIEIIIHNVVE